MENPDRAGGKALWLPLPLTAPSLPLRESASCQSRTQGRPLATGHSSGSKSPQEIRTRCLGSTCGHSSCRGISRLFRLCPTLQSNWGPPKYLHHVCLGPCLIRTLHVWQKYGFLFNLHRRASCASWRQTVCRQRQSKQSRDKEVTCERQDMQRVFVKDTCPVPLS